MHSHLFALLYVLFASLAAVLADGGGVPSSKAAGPDSEKQCLSLGKDFKTSTGMEINNTFSQYFPEGSMPSMELLTALYPAGTIPPRTNVASILSGAGPDIDIKSDSGYGKSKTRASDNGPTDGMPAFCRFGAYIKTSPLTIVLMEVWMPLASDPAIALASVNQSDFPTNTTSPLVNKDGTFARAPTYITKGQFELPKPGPGSHSPLAPNDIPVRREEKASKKAGTSNTTKVGGGTTPMPVDPLTQGGTSQQQSMAATPVLARTLHGKRASRLDRKSTTVKEGPSTKTNGGLSGEEVLGPGDGWNGRIAQVGNGGQRGWVPFPDLKQVTSRYRFAAVGSNLGHFSNSNGVVWINGSQFNETLVDYGSRGNHVSLLLAEDVLDTFYGKTEGVRVVSDNNRVRRYYLGSSNGGGRGMSSIQVYPRDFHGLLLGAPSFGFMDLNIGQIATQKRHVRKEVGKGWFTQGALYGPIRDVVVRQCDELDGVKDGIISNPFECKPRLEEELLCGGQGTFSSSNGTCLTKVQIENAYMLYNDTYLDGHFVYPRYLPGLEDSASVMSGSSRKASGWTQLVVYRYPRLDPDFDQYNNISYEALQRGNAEDPGGINILETNLTPFVQAGAKAILYHGTYDLVISPVATINYVEEAWKETTGLQDAMRLYLVPGMQHSRGGPGPYHFGGITMRDPGNRPLRFDTDHDMTLALVAWVERERAPEAQVAATYQSRSTIVPSQETGGRSEPARDLPIPEQFQNFNWGIQNTRLLCPYPKQTRYMSGMTEGEQSHQSFECV